MTKAILFLAFWAIGSMLIGHAAFNNPDHDARFGFVFLGLTMAFIVLGALLTLAKWKFFG